MDNGNSKIVTWVLLSKDCKVPLPHELGKHGCQCPLLREPMRIITQRARFGDRRTTTPSSRTMIGHIVPDTAPSPFGVGGSRARQVGIRLGRRLGEDARWVREVLGDFLGKTTRGSGRW
jgi:hypothetical protein